MLAKAPSSYLRIACALLTTCCVARSHAQEMTPRAYWPAPAGTQVVVIGYSHATGDILFDPSIPLYGVDSKLDTLVLGYVRTTSLFGRTSNLIVDIPFSSGVTSGFIGDVPASGSYSGTGDIGATISINLLGAPSMTMQEFAELRANPHPLLGASVKVVMPTGRYNSGRLLNVGMNRWALKAELGFMAPLTKKWHLEIDAGAWFFDDDEKFIGGRREQEAVLSTQAHLVRRFSPGFWASLDANFFTGGRQTINGNRLRDVQRNAKLGVTLVVPFKRRQALKFGYATGVQTRYGTDFTQYLMSYQFVLK